MPSSLSMTSGSRHAARHGDRDHPPPLEGAVVGERGLVLLVAEEGELVELATFDAGLGSDRLRGVDHRLARPTDPS